MRETPRFDARTSISVTQLLELTHDRGPVALLTEANDQVHLRQGDMDGACGPYSLTMALIAMGLITRAEAMSAVCPDRRTLSGKFTEKLWAFDPLFSEGVDIDDLKWLADGYRNRDLQVEISSARTKRRIALEVAKATDEGGAAIIRIDWLGGGGHWMLAVGHQSRQLDYSEPRCLTHILCLDPGQATPRASLWNSVLYHTDPIGQSLSRGRYSVEYWGMDGAKRLCRLTEAVILKRPEQVAELVLHLNAA
ncbi:hypothetical protein K9U39_05950 [Rhodoblastus acidophilus]|uniref:Peptidase C39-like domain-containing protein n=1 Tax=Candidatus Rhodoblastus alkanivorans TaxID=2954117 RepID=A0ABS9Z6B5_9HYPH|nr:hypothetical protein [Candidatus Rhodoblastus alkanivorans]MCI4679187.1 hypothetical protein [Candidatus Rhodoblastus alkanivorans]MCI4683183.1 hypothetical protein [Candidatus Rhodoblastus alkanivorans]MDI4640495.1 hypothetical protein [Rhodoblastus acidophilus]